MTDKQRETNQTFYDRISQVYDLISDSSEREVRELGEAALELQPGECVLEIGFGTGSSLLKLADGVGAAGKVVGIDVSPGMRSIAEQKLVAQGLQDRVTLVVGDARELPFEDATFDAVFLSFTLELFPLDEIPTVLQSLARVLKSTGRVVIVCMSTVKDGQRASVLERTYVWMHRHFPHIIDCQPIDAAEHLRAAGFDVHKSFAREIWTMPVTVVVAGRSPM